MSDFKLNPFDSQYIGLLQKILAEGHEKSDRTGVGTKSIFSAQVRFNVKSRFPLLTTKKMYYKGIIHELLWFLKGDTNIKYLVDNGVNIWNGNAYNYYEKNYKHLNQEKFGKIDFIDKIKKGEIDIPATNYKLGDLGNVYGKQWRNWKGFKQGYNTMAPYEYDTSGIDQIAKVIKTLKNNPDSRRIMVNAWNVAEIDNMALPPCHFSFELYSRELTYNERVKYVDNEVLVGWTKKMVSTEDFIKHTIEYMDENNVPKRALSLVWNQRSVDTFLGELAPSESNFCRNAA